MFIKLLNFKILNFNLITTILLIQAVLGQTFAQGTLEIINIPNGSFEGISKGASCPKEWVACGYNSTPDILPGPWGVTTIPSEGNSYLGLTAREDKTFEAISTKLLKPLRKNQCYSFKVDLCRSSAYAGFNGAGTMRIWGAKSSCERRQLLAVSPVISNYDWKTISFSFFAKDTYDYIIIECYYKMPSLFHYRANILIDSFFYFESCDRA
jgi:hypothetical protein